MQHAWPAEEHDDNDYDVQHNVNDNYDSLISTTHAVEDKVYRRCRGL